MKKPYSYIIAVVVVVLAFLLYKNLTSCKRLSCIRMAGLDKFSVKDVYQENGHAFRAQYGDGENIMKTEVVYNTTETDAEQYINSGIAKLQGVYTDALVPYPGVASQQTGCEKKYQPVLKKINTNTQISYFTGFLNSNLTFGTCIESQISHKGMLILFYCPKSKQAYELQIIAKKDLFEKNSQKYRQMAESITCL